MEGREAISMGQLDTVYAFWPGSAPVFCLATLSAKVQASNTKQLGFQAQSREALPEVSPHLKTRH